MNSLLLSLLTLAPAATPPLPPTAVPAVAPVVYVKVLGPMGMNATFHPGTTGAKKLTTPADVALRPGYFYRLQLDGIPGLPATFYPSLEVRGAVQMSMAQAARHPIPLVFTEDELKRVYQTGAMVTKVFFMEDPAQAMPIQTTPNDPLVIDVPAGTDPLDDARHRGRPMIVVRIGERELTREELTQFALPNTILFTGEARLGLPPAPPMVSWVHWPMFDPLIGAKRGAEECLPDGGDIGPRIGFGPDGKLGGLNASDSAVEYKTEAGKRRVAPSNRVCILVPRFAIARQEIAPAGIASSLATSGFKGTKGNQVFHNRIPAGRADNVIQLAATTGRKGPSGMQNKVALHGYDQVKGVKIVGSVAGTKVVGKVQEPDEITAYPFCEPISLFKWAEPKEAQVGDVVTFYLRYHNHTKQSVENLVVSDSLTARLEYIPGSARSDREATLTIQANEVGSVVLRWELSGKLLASEHGVVAFQARVR